MIMSDLMGLEIMFSDELIGMYAAVLFDENPPARARGREHQLITIAEVVVIDRRAKEEYNAY